MVRRSTIATVPTASQQAQPIEISLLDRIPVSRFLADDDCHSVLGLLGREIDAGRYTRGRQPSADGIGDVAAEVGILDGEDEYHARGQ